MTLGSICHNSLSGQERWCKVHSVEQDWALVQCGRQVTLGTAGGWCVVFDCYTLLTDGVPGLVHDHGLQAENVNLEELDGCQLLKPVLILSPLHFSQFHQS